MLNGYVTFLLKKSLTPSTTGLILLSAATETADATEYIGI